MIVDAWAQHPTLRHAQDPMLESLRRWNREETPTEELPVAATIRAMDEAGVAKSLISAWLAPRNTMISNDEVAGFVREYPDRRAGIGSADISRPIQAVAEIRRCVEDLGFRASACFPGCGSFGLDGQALPGAARRLAAHAPRPQGAVRLQLRYLGDARWTKFSGSSSAGPTIPTVIL